MLSCPGYAGFRRDNVDRDLLTEEIAISESDRHHRFARAAKETVYGSKPEALGATAVSLNSQIGTTLKPTDYKVPEKKSIYSRQPMEKKFIHKSLATSTFPDYMAEAFKLKDHTEAEYEAAFHRVDTDKSGYITSDEIRALLREVLGDEPSDHQQRTFTSYFDKNKDGRISLSEFKRGLEGVTAHMEAAAKTATRAGTDASGAPSWAPKKSAKVISDGVRASSMMLDVGVAGHDPRHRRMTDGTGMYGTTKDLYAGTSKVAMHLPGYAGYLSESQYRRNATAQGQSTGAVPHDTFNDKTPLDQTFLRRVPGYTGHLPATNPAETIGLARPTGQFASTESAAADAMVQRYWESRARK